jgi:inner membrane protein
MAFIDRNERTPGAKFAFTLLIAALLAVPLFAVYLLVYDRQTQSEAARSSIAEGWGGPQTIAGPVLAIPYQSDATQVVTEGGVQITRTTRVWRELVLAPAAAELQTRLAPEKRARSIYEVVVYAARTTGEARFVLPSDLARRGIALNSLALDRAELRFGLSDARGLFGAPPRVVVDGVARPLQPGKGPREAGGEGFFAWVDAGSLRAAPLVARFDYAFRGNGWLSLVPTAGDTRWRVTSPWQQPSFQGGFLPERHRIAADGFDATWRVGNLALGRGLTDTADAGGPTPLSTGDAASPAGAHEARVTLVTPVDLYARVNRSVKYGFLFIGFTFTAFLLFDIVGGVRVSAVEYLLVGAGLILFFVMLLSFAEVVGFLAAYGVAAAAIVALLTAYSAAVLRSRRRAGFIAALLAGLYGVLYVLMSLEEFSLLIGSMLLFAALASVMYLTRNLEWGGASATSQTDA